MFFFFKKKKKKQKNGKIIKRSFFNIGIPRTIFETKNFIYEMNIGS